MVLSFVSGLMLGVALLHLIPHSFVAAGEIDTVMAWTLAGLVFMLLLLRLLHFHQHDFGAAADECAMDSMTRMTMHMHTIMPIRPREPWALWV